MICWWWKMWVKEWKREGGREGVNEGRSEGRSGGGREGEREGVREGGGEGRVGVREWGREGGNEGGDAYKNLTSWWECCSFLSFLSAKLILSKKFLIQWYPARSNRTGSTFNTLLWNSCCWVSYSKSDIELSNHLKASWNKRWRTELEYIE